MKVTIFDQFLAGSEFASALIYLGLGCLIGWNILGTLFMLRSIIAKEMSAIVTATLITVLFSALAAFAIGILGFLLVSRDPKVSIVDLLFLLGPMILIPAYCWRIETIARIGVRS